MLRWIGDSFEIPVLACVLQLARLAVVLFCIAKCSACWCCGPVGFYEGSA